MKDQPLIILGASGHSKVIIDIFEKTGYQILGLLDNTKAGELVLGYEVLGGDEVLGELLQKHKNLMLFVAIGDNHVRCSVAEKVRATYPSVQFANAINPQAVLAREVKLGQGIALMAGAVINPGSTLGDFSMVNTNASLDHDNILGKGASLAPNSVTGGNVTIGDFAAVSIGATVNAGLQIGENAVVGAGSVLMKDCPAHTLMYGVPARIIRPRKMGEKYL